MTAFELNLLRIMLFAVPMFVTIYAIEDLKERNIFNINFKKVESRSKAEYLVFRLIDLITGRDNESNVRRLQEYMILHKELLEGHDFFHRILNSIESKNEGRAESDVEEIEESWDEFFLHITSAIIKKKPSSRIFILQAFYQYGKMDKIWESINSLNSASLANPSVVDKFSSARMTFNLENLVKSRNKEVIKNIGVNILEVISFEDKFHLFLNLIQNSVEQLIDFWRELNSEDPAGKKIHRLGLHLTKNYKDIDEIFNEIAEMNVDVLKSFRIYNSFLKQVAHDDKKINAMQEKLQYTVKGMALKNELEKDESEIEAKDILLITLSGNESSLGVVLNASNSLYRYLGWKPSEVIGENVNIIQPSFFAKLHASFLKRFFRSEKPRILNKNIVVFGQTKKGYLKNIKIRVMFMPSLEMGIRLVGILTDFTNEDLPPIIQDIPEKDPIHYIMFNMESGDIIGLSESCNEHFGINANLFKDVVTGSPDIGMFIKDAMDFTKHEKMKSEGLYTDIDTTMLQEDYYYIANAQNELEDVEKMQKEYLKKVREKGRESYNEGNGENKDPSIVLSSVKEKDERFRKARIRAWLVDFMSYVGKDLCCIRFYEIKEDRESTFEDYEEMDLDMKEEIKESMKQTTGDTVLTNEVSSPFFNFARGEEEGGRIS